MGIFSKSFPNVRQLGAMDCGPTCIKMIAKYYGRDFSVSFLREKCFIIYCFFIKLIKNQYLAKYLCNKACGHTQRKMKK